ncbi:MAG: hypothetical protein M1300_04515 [Epsilonproteobacteria bacterium]|nr:hypothetical protein [Campylobacterota bacterium]
MQYAIVQHSDLKGLNKLVNKAIGEGWEPQGGVSVSSERTSTISRYSVYCQAMVLHSDKMASIETGEIENGKISKEATLIQKIVGVVLVLGIIAAIVKWVF